MQAYLHHALYSKFYNNVCEEYLATFLASVLELGKKVAVVKKKKQKKHGQPLHEKYLVCLVGGLAYLDGGRRRRPGVIVRSKQIAQDV